ncbi:hypothetical protein CBJ89_001971 [Salmonella enterica subsp. enterica serovar Essen]|uniref:toxin YdaT family protein n=1 Tax=Salmonella enterica TaxID=28901 RepID=UPI001279BCA7|nr:toxin YdaT family protein [Salmonella enterica]EBX2183594.1 hypothetical protein [Salmonella enterica subsp. enterica serovar Aba]EBY6260746.1 hypothetical protein [Salmonella enterica subsp. enterica serovar Warnow]EBZ0012545.1 hypothetical protein [Salmonella enterica subsp. enterica serovar Suberu]ECB3807398.1 hypothetical protein [Salmonella enterica subsp. enterica serovar Fufu]ECI7956915.1 hypothetical protein [Salmonella enterica subsp. enterica]EDU3844930.1 hypothetical protein [Sa
MNNPEELKRDILTWAARAGQEHVTIEICRAWFRHGGNTQALKLHEIEDCYGNADWRAINNNRQLIFRWLNGETKAARRKTMALAGAMDAALCNRLESSPQFLICQAIREFAAAIIAILLEARDRPQQIAKALQAMQETMRLTSAI